MAVCSQCGKKISAQTSMVHDGKKLCLRCILNSTQNEITDQNEITGQPAEQTAYEPPLLPIQPDSSASLFDSNASLQSGTAGDSRARTKNSSVLLTFVGVMLAVYIVLSCFLGAMNAIFAGLFLIMLLGGIFGAFDENRDGQYTSEYSTPHIYESPQPKTYSGPTLSDIAIAWTLSSASYNRANRGAKRETSHRAYTGDNSFDPFDLCDEGECFHDHEDEHCHEDCDEW